MSRRQWSVLLVLVALVALALMLVPRAQNSSNAPEAGDQAAASPPEGDQAAASPPETEREIRSAYGPLTLTTYTQLLPPPERRRAGGALAALGDGGLVVTATGDFYRLSWNPSGARLQAERLPLSVPFNRAAFRARAGDDDALPARVTDLLVDPTPSGTRLYVSHHHWHAEENCVTLRVSWTQLGNGDTVDSAARWETLFDSQPCLAVGAQWPLGEEADRSGGRLARHRSGLLLTVGDHGLDSTTPSWPQTPTVSYGKILLIDEKGKAVPFSVGHRNQQGLTVDADGRVWSTEHGPEGGDEVNLVVRGGNYGWPLATYGTAYNSDTWPLAVNPHDHGSFREPAVAFVPSIGIGQLIQVRSNYFPRWTGDLLVASLQAGNLFRMRTRGDRIIYSEAINVFTRVRDLAEASNGRLLLWDDDGQVAVLMRAGTTGS